MTDHGIRFEGYLAAWLWKAVDSEQKGVMQPAALAGASVTVAATRK
ncbi:hypothetical protein GO594_14275 [Pseudomonas otitidis]|uniref:Uncharacterized protein n=1 Tax=Metapseudomonas otitidis TaxID=319939 RepID=A0A7X3H8L5_9GAMM|nr:hypothetical protein [Pseudomonas otitidis]MWK57147.1 hypothetical protein [Pseudomonas otitidis]